MITLYTTHCPKCKALEMKLKMKKIDDTECSDVKIMQEKGFKQAPMLDVNGKIMDFTEAIQYVNGMTSYIGGVVQDKCDKCSL